MNKYRKSILLLSILGAIDSVYLWIIKLVNKPTLCIQGVGDCWSVNTSKYSEINGIPISVLGAVAYLLIIIIIIFENRIELVKRNSTLAVFGITLIGVVYSAYLTYLEIWIIRAICPFCILSALIMLALFSLSIIGLKNDQALN